MSFAIDAEEQTTAEEAMALAFCPSMGVLTRSAAIPDGMGGETKEDALTVSIRFGVSQRSSSPTIDGERTRAAVFATVRVPMSSDVRELDIIEDSATGEQWEVQAIVFGQFAQRLSCLLVREG
jgi:hypothetical protein